MKSYTFKKFKKQLLPYLLSFAIVLGAFSWKAPEADAIATEAVVAAIISVAIGSGLAFAVDRMTSPEVDAYWTGQAQQWLQSVGQSYSDFVDQAEQNMSAKDGKLILGGSFYQSIQNFLNWWRGENNVETGSTSVSVTSTLGVDLPFYSSFADARNDASNGIGYSPTLIGATDTPDSSYPFGFYVQPTSTNPSRCYIWLVNSSGVHKLNSASKSYIPTYIALALNPEGNLYLWGYSAHTSGNLFLYSDLVNYLEGSISVSQSGSLSILEPTEALPSVSIDVGASSEDDLDSVIRSVLDGYLDNTLVVDQELTGAGEGEGTDTDGLFGILHGISGTLSDVLDAVLSIPAALAATVTGFIGSIGNFLSGAYFGFSGIWHYVVTWVGSMAAGAAVIWSIWNGLPSAMVIPVFATAVIVIVVGLWRRFFE